jgi:hypothetical protein
LGGLLEDKEACMKKAKQKYKEKQLLQKSI